MECWELYKTFPSTEKLTLKPTSQGNVDLYFWLGLLWDPSDCSSVCCPLSPLLSFIAISDSLETPLPSILFPLHGLFSYSPLKHREKVPCIHVPSSSGELNFFGHISSMKEIIESESCNFMRQLRVSENPAHFSSVNTGLHFILKLFLYSYFSYLQ